MSNPQSPVAEAAEPLDQATSILNGILALAEKGGAA